MSTDDKNTGTPIGQMEPRLRIVGRNPMRPDDITEPPPPPAEEPEESEQNMEDNAKVVVLTNLAYNIFLGVLTPDALRTQLRAEQWGEDDIVKYLAEVAKYVTPLRDYVDLLVTEQMEENGESDGPKTASDLLDRVGVRLFDLLSETEDLQGMDLTISFVHAARGGGVGMDMRVTIGLPRVAGWEQDIPNLVTRASREKDRLGELIDATLTAAVKKTKQG